LIDESVPESKRLCQTLQLPHSVFLETWLLHECGYGLHVSIGVAGTGKEVVLSGTTLSFQVSHAQIGIVFKCHGARVKYCPGCRKELPRILQDAKHSDFREGDAP
jgi:hypothetical protein